MADVRLTKVRAWLAGKRNKLNHNVILIHLGNEQFRRPDDTPYPKRLDPPEEKDQDRRKPRYIKHEPVSIPFNYNAEGLKYNANESQVHAWQAVRQNRGVAGRRPSLSQGTEFAICRARANTPRSDRSAGGGSSVPKLENLRPRLVHAERGRHRLPRISSGFSTPNRKLAPASGWESGEPARKIR